MLDPGPYAFSNFTTQPQGYYTPTPGGTNTIYHPQAGDLHTPSLGMGMGINTPLSLPTGDGPIHAGHGIMDMPPFAQAMPQQQFHQQPFPQFLPTAQHPLPFVPPHFGPQDTGYETMEHDGSPLGSDGPIGALNPMATTYSSQSPQMGQQHSRTFGTTMTKAPPPLQNNFRFQCTLNAPTAMIRQADEILVTYLNKGQAYQLTVQDTSSNPAPPGTKYRTYVRISFEDDQQRQKPAVCWSLWKEGRGASESHQRGGRLQAVEYCESGPSADGVDRKAQIELEDSSFDGFCVQWTPAPLGLAECTIIVRFNFLSTDFSHSKGVKGIPVRLCAKTSIVPAAGSPHPADPVSEICYCKVKLFRDHGAERKLANDVAHVKKTMEKLKQQIAQAEGGGKDIGKRKRGGAHGKTQDPQRPGKAPKHKRTWSMSSISSADGVGGGDGRNSFEDDLNFKLRSLQDMFTSPRASSLLYLKGDELDDPDLHPISFSKDSVDLPRVDSKESVAWLARSKRNSAAESSLVSPSPSSLSLQSQATSAAPWSDRHTSGEPRYVSDQPVKLPKIDPDGSVGGWIDAIGVDPSYKPPAERLPKPIASFYILRRQPANPGERTLHRVVYLTERNLANFISQVSAKWGLDPKRVTGAVHVLESGLEIEMDDDVIRELAEGQDMVLEVADAELNLPQECEAMAVDDILDGDGNSPRSAYRRTTGYELRFSF